MSIRFNKSYTLEEGPPHIPIGKYLERTERQFSNLLESNPSEREVQSFLERHPSMVPGHSTPAGLSGHYPLHCSLITQPELPGKPFYKPDFMWLARHSGEWFPTLIEIEKPGKKMFTKKGDPNAEFSHARNQLNQWQAWFKNPNNVQLFMDYYGIPPGWKHSSWRLHMILIYGRRQEIDEQPNLRVLRSGLLTGNDEEIMSFDRLAVYPLIKDFITVKASGAGRYQAVNIPSTFATGPDLAVRLLHIDGVEEAIDRNEDIDKERREFLKERVSYWREWASTPYRGILTTGHRE